VYAFIESPSLIPIVIYAQRSHSTDLSQLLCFLLHWQRGIILTSETISYASENGFQSGKFRGVIATFNVLIALLLNIQDLWDVNAVSIRFDIQPDNIYLLCCHIRYLLRVKK
jgi:hypothetical protein